MGTEDRVKACENTLSLCIDYSQALEAKNGILEREVEILQRQNKELLELYEDSTPPLLPGWVWAVGGGLLGLTVGAIVID